jgi:hypothetical protein
MPPKQLNKFIKMTNSGESFNPLSVESPRSGDTNGDPILMQGTSANLSRRYG